MHRDEIATDETLVRRLLEAQFPHWAKLPIGCVLSAGTDNALYRLGEDLVARFPRIHWARDDVHKEFFWLPKLAPLLPLSIPVPLAKGRPGEGYPWHWTIGPWLNGENASIERIADIHSFTKKLAQFISALHQIDLKDGPPASRGVPLSQRDAPTCEAIAKLTRIIDTETASALWKESLKIPEWHSSPVWVHGDLSPGNLLMANGQLSAVIDFGGLGVGDPACDLIVAWNLLTATMRKDFSDALQIDEATWARGRGWALSVALIQLPYYLHTNPVIAANARHVIAEVLADFQTNQR
jgi:aminoglycoside phosphotransferase (APT) family kinase protein